MSFSEFDMNEIEAARKRYAAGPRSAGAKRTPIGRSAQKTARYGKEEWRQSVR